MMTIEKLRERFIREEGMKLKPYRCSANKITIGAGRNLDDKGISEQEALMMLDNDIQQVLIQCGKNIQGFAKMPENCQYALVDMAFNLGIGGVLKFQNTLKLIRDKKYQEAGKELLNSAYARQVPNRARRNSDLIANS